MTFLIGLLSLKASSRTRILLLQITRIGLMPLAITVLLLLLKKKFPHVYLLYLRALQGHGLLPLNL
jgi:hypothetical protein